MPHRRRLAAGFCLLILVACDDGGLALRAPWLEVPDTARLENVPVGATSQLSVLVANTGTRQAEVALSVSAPLAMATRSLTLAAGDEGLAVVLVTPDDYAGLSGELEVRVGADLHVVDLEITVATDLDDDGFEAEGAGGQDCDDEDPRVNPAAVESCNGRDSDCNGVVDDPQDPPQWFPDRDLDGYGDEDAAPAEGCTPPGAGWVGNGLDCDDANADVNPDALEVSTDDIDNDCDGIVG